VAAIERMIGIVRVHLRSAMGADGIWTNDDLWRIEHTINATRSQAQGDNNLSAFEELLGYQPASPFAPAGGLERPTHAVGAALRENRSQGWHRPSFLNLQDDHQARGASSAQRIDQHRLESRIVPDSVVAIHHKFVNLPVNNFQDSMGAKGRPIFHAPFKVISIAPDGNLMVDLNNGKPPLKVHQSHVKLLPATALAVPHQKGQPPLLLWPDGSPKVRLITNKRTFHNSTQYLAFFWGKHNVHARWVSATDIPRDQHAITAFERRAAQGLPSRFPR
jgi:hypothetical protein